MASWGNLKCLDNSFLDFKIGRSPEVDREYETRLKDPNFKINLIDMITNYLESNQYWIRDNDFPYCFNDSCIQHKVFWFNGSLSMREAKSIVNEELNIAADNIVICCNKPVYKSVPEIQHYHIFFKI